MLLRMKTVNIFKTSVRYRKEANWMISLLETIFPYYKLNFDLDDCDHILRVENPNENIPVYEIEVVVRAAGYSCTHLP